MNEAETMTLVSMPNTHESLLSEFKKLGIKNGDIVIAHVAMSKLGWVVGREVTVIDALLEAVGQEGTLIMPSQSGDNSDPSLWQKPPVPHEWVEIIKTHMPPYDPNRTPTRMMGKVVEAFLKYPGVLRSYHPQVSFCGYGKQAQEILDNHQLSPGLGDGSPLKKLYDKKAKILLLGVGYGNCTALHLAESHQADVKWYRNGSCMTIEGKATWVEFDEICYQDDDFERLGNDFEKANQVMMGCVGAAQCRYIDLCDLVDYAEMWLKEKRK